jgi:hypothetical protein
LGVYRSGKSLLLNRLSRLTTPYTGGFGVGHGQRTYTRGIEVCGEWVEGLGTIVWMDTEGLFSAEEARSAYGPKIFSLALLFSSSVLLNSVKVLNDQFFDFFGEQQQLARVLKQGLGKEGLPQDALLPGNLSVFWVLQQPVRFSGVGQTDQSQLQAFLNLPGDEARSHVRRGFRHTSYEVPVAVADVRKFNHLEKLDDTELMPEYVASAEGLRIALLDELRDSAPGQQAATIATQLRLFVDIVSTEQFSGTLAKEAFQDAEIGKLCDTYARNAATHAGGLPSASMESGFKKALSDLEAEQVKVSDAFHFDAEWARRLHRCLKSREKELRERNGEVLLDQWRAAVAAAAEGSGPCFFLGRLAKLLSEYVDKYGPDSFSASVRARAVDYASALQRTRLVECVRLRDVLWPFVPWLAWPLCSFYLQGGGGVFVGMLSMGLHGIVILGVYTVLQLFQQLPTYLNVDYPVLRAHPLLLDLVMRAPPLVPWAALASFVGLVGTAWSAWMLLRLLMQSLRPGAWSCARQAHSGSQLVNLELKLNMLLVRTEATFKQQFVEAALDAQTFLERDDARAAARALMKGLCAVREVSDQDLPLAARVGPHLLKRCRTLLRDGKHFPQSSSQKGLAEACADNSLAALAAQEAWGPLVREMADQFEKLMSTSPHGKARGQKLTQRITRTLSRLSACSESTAAEPEAEADATTEETNNEEGSVSGEDEHGFTENDEVDESEMDEQDVQQQPFVGSSAVAGMSTAFRMGCTAASVLLVAALCGQNLVPALTTEATARALGGA